MPIKLRPRTGFTAPTPLRQIRDSLLAAVKMGNWQTAITPFDETINGVRVLRYRPETPKPGAIIHFHGGGYRMGCPELGAHYATRLAETCKLEVICPAYGLAPERPFPCGLLDAFAVLKETSGLSNSSPLIISGESAGGGLAVAATLLALEHNIPVDGAILLSPWLDLTLTASSYQTNATLDELFSYESASAAAELYLQGEPPQNPLASPVFADVSNFPPTYISTGNIEVLVEDSRKFTQLLQRFGREVIYREVPQMAHVAVVRDIEATGALQTAEDIEQFVDGIVRGPSQR